MARPKKSKADKIRTLLAQGKTVAEIIKTTGASAAYVYGVKSKWVAGTSGLTALESVVKKQPTKPSGIASITVTPNGVKPCEWAELSPPAPTLWQRIVKWFKGD
jgi:hypothetical protein